MVNVAMLSMLSLLARKAKDKTKLSLPPVRDGLRAMAKRLVGGDLLHGPLLHSVQIKSMPICAGPRQQPVKCIRAVVNSVPFAVLNGIVDS